MKSSVKRILTFIFALTLLLALTACGKSDSSNITGKWSVTSYKYDDKIYTRDEMSEMMGSAFDETYGNTVITFNDDGSFSSQPANGESQSGTYKISDSEVSFYDESDDLITTMTISDDTLELTVPDINVEMYILYEKQ